MTQSQIDLALRIRDQEGVYQAALFMFAAGASIEAALWLLVYRT